MPPRQRTLDSFFAPAPKRSRADTPSTHTESLQSSPDTSQTTPDVVPNVAQAAIPDAPSTEVGAAVVGGAGAPVAESLPSAAPVLSPRKAPEVKDDMALLPPGEVPDVSEKALSEVTVSNQARLMLASRCDPFSEDDFKKGEHCPYYYLCKTFERISQESARLQVTQILADCYRRIIALAPYDLIYAVYLSVNKIAPSHLGIELGVGDSLLVKAVSQSAGCTEDATKARMEKEGGDIGRVAQAVKSRQQTLCKPQPLTVRQVWSKFREIAQQTGNETMRRRVDLIHKLLVASRDTETQFIVRAAQGSLRIGLAEQTVLSALAIAFIMTPPRVSRSDLRTKYSPEQLQALINTHTERLKQVFSELPSYDLVIPMLLRGGIKGLYANESFLTLGLPVKPMLAKATHGVQEVLKRMNESKFTCEYKYDGERAQIHFDRSRKSPFSIFSRNSEDHTTKYPDIIDMLPECVNESIENFILDCEVVAWDPVAEVVKPFQALQHRGRKNIKLEDIQVPVCVFPFDLLYFNGKSLLHEPFRTRRDLLRHSFVQVAAKFQFAISRDVSTEEDISTILNESMEANCEGLMVKTLDIDATYTPSKRTFNWLKVKKDYLQGVVDTLDLVPIGGYSGRGKRSGWYGGFLMACYNEEREEYQTICKMGTGFSEEQLEKYTEEMAPFIISTPPVTFAFADDHRPNVWFKPTYVWEVKAADFTISPTHRAAFGLVEPGKGIALRFPRFLRAREDKAPYMATSSVQIAELYRNQGQYRVQVNQAVQAAAANDSDKEDDENP